MTRIPPTGSSHPRALRIPPPRRNQAAEIQSARRFLAVVQVDNPEKIIHACLETGIDSQNLLALILELMNILRNDRGAKYAFYVLPNSLQAGLAPDQITSLFRETLSLFGFFPDFVIDFLPAAYAAELSLTDILAVLRACKSSRLVREKDAFNGLAAALPSIRARFSPAESVVLIQGVASAISYVLANALDCLPVVINSERPIGEIINFFKMIQIVCEEKDMMTSLQKQINAFEFIPFALNAGLTFEQILELFTPVTAEDLSPAGRLIIILQKFSFYKRRIDPLIAELEINSLTTHLKSEGEKAKARSYPTLGGKLGGKSSAFCQGFVPLLRLHGIRMGGEILGTGFDSDTMITLPVARSSSEAILLIDLLGEAGLFQDGMTFRHQVTISGRLQEEAKYIALALHSAQVFPVKFPEKLPDYAGFKTVAPVAEGGGDFEDINGTGEKERFDLPLLRIHTFADPPAILHSAQAKEAKDQSVVESMLVETFAGLSARWSELPPEDTLVNVPDENLQAVLVAQDGEGNGAFLQVKRERPDPETEFFKALEKVFGNGYTHIRHNHHFTVNASMLLAWAMQSPPRSHQGKMYIRLMKRMEAIYQRYGLADALATTWIGKKWDEIYPSLAQIEAVEEEHPAFRKRIRTLAEQTISALAAVRREV